jgi:hypothetical protein
LNWKLFFYFFTRPEEGLDGSGHKTFAMLIIAQHTNITDPETFWAKAQTVVSSAPEGTKVHSVYPSQDGKTGTCVWEGNSVGEIQNFLDEAAAGIATNYCYEVNEKIAVGLPQRKMEAALN